MLVHPGPIPRPQSAAEVRTYQWVGFRV